jgi:hypothetical protein
MTPDRITVSIDRIAIHGGFLPPDAAGRIGARVERGLAARLSEAPWPAHSRRTAVAASTPATSLAGGERGIADAIVATVMGAIGSGVAGHE